MSKFSKLMIFVLLLILAACNRPTQPPIDIEATQEIVEDTGVPDQPADTSQPADTDVPLPTQEDPTPQPPTDTPQEIILEGDRVPLLPAGSVVDIRELHMLDLYFGWALTADAAGIFHVLKTEFLATSWRDISPPQPINPNSNWFTAEVNFSDPDHGWVSYNDSDLIWRTVDSGITWEPSLLEYETRLGSMIHSLDNDHVWLFQFLDAGMQKVHVALYSSSDGGATWTKLLDPMTAPDYSIQGFDKTGVDFLDPDYGWLTRNFRGVSPDVRLDITLDGGVTWQALDLPAPPSAPDAFNNCACGLSDPKILSQQEGMLKLECMCSEGGGNFTKNYLYQTSDGGENWDIEYIPEGELHHIQDDMFFIINREIYRTTVASDDWVVVNTVNWDGQFSFIDMWTAFGVAYNPDTDVYALVETRDGCRKFALIETKIIESQSIR